MSLDVSLIMPACIVCTQGERTVFDANITHNLNDMAEAAGIYEACWHPEEIGATHARDIISHLRKGLEWLREHPAAAKEHNSPNGWGNYEDFVPWVERYLEACVKYPNARIEAWR